MQSPRYRALLRSLFGAVMKSDLDAGQLKALAEELRRGQLSDELAFMLDQVNVHFRDNSRDNSRDISDEMKYFEDIIKSKRISKNSLLNILISIDSRSSFSSSATMREILEEFLSGATSRQIEKLAGTLSATGRPDPFLKGISEQNR